MNKPQLALVPGQKAKEHTRLEALESYNLLDTPNEVIFDELARMAAALCETPIALVSLVDGRRQWFKARVGMDAQETPRDQAFCAHAIKESGPMIVPDALDDERFASNPLVTAEGGIRFYAGAPLITAEGHALGTLCVIDRVPRQLSPERIEGLKLLSRHVVAHMELRKRYTSLSAESDQRIRTLETNQEQLDSLILEQQSQIEKLAHHNPQTGLANRALFLSRLEKLLTSSILGDEPVTVFVVDIQRFGLVSESVGQSHLDSVLQQVGQRLALIMGSNTNIAHLEADRFAAYSNYLPSAAAASSFLEDAVLPALCSPYSVDDEELRIAFKAGISIAPPEGISPEKLLRRAKTALAKARESDGTYAVFTADLEARVSEIVSLETKLRRAIEEEQFEVFYQPKVSLVDGSISGVEALLRWQDRNPDVREPGAPLPWVPPARFVPALEATGLILDVGRWVLKRAVADFRDWQQMGLKAPPIAVNISPLQLRHKDFLKEIEAILKSPGVTPLIDIELTEAVLMENADQCIESLKTLQSWGVRVAIDDFGSGYSSLRYLARLPINVLKIDMAFIHAMTKSPDNMSIVSSVISLAHALRFKTVAEGVETDEQRNLLRLLRCDEIQGYLFSKPISKPELESLLRAQ